MRKLLILGGWVLLVGACGTHAATRGPTLPLPHPSVTVPAKITDSSYERYRELYDALPLRSAQRPALRAVLRDHLLAVMDRQLARDDEAKAVKSFSAALTLYDASEVFEEKARDRALARAAAKILARFGPRGDEQRVLLALAVQMSQRPHSSAADREFNRATQWLVEVDTLMHHSTQRWQRLIAAMEKAARVWPSPFVVAYLRKLHVQHKVSVSRSINVMAHRHLRGAVAALFRTAFKIVRLYLRVDRPKQALRWLNEVSTEPKQDAELRRLLERVTSPSATAADHIALADFFADQSPAVALRVCRGAQRRFADAPETHACVGRRAAALKRTHLAILSLERAVKLAPDEREYAEALAEQYQRRLFGLIGDEHLAEARQKLEGLEAFYRRARQRYKKSLSPPLSTAYYAIGQGLYNAGQVQQAASTLKKSVDAERSPRALLQLATIELKQDQPTQSLGYLDLAARATSSSAAPVGRRLYWQGQLAEIRAQAMGLLGEQAKARAAHRRAVEAWRQLRSLGLKRDEDRAEALLSESRNLYALGLHGPALDAMEEAIDVEPRRKETYADVIALLTTHGHLPEALDAYHRALGHDELGEYLKTYCSFWVVELARRAGAKPDALALQHLKGLEGDKWYVRLAQAMLGRTTFAALEAEAKTPSNRAELYYYWAQQELARGKTQRARALWKKVLQTNMMAFYEYDMAAHNLKHGPAKVATMPVDRVKSAEPTSTSANQPQD